MTCIKKIIFGFLIVTIMWYKRMLHTIGGGGVIFKKNLHIRLFVFCCINANPQSWPSSWCEKNSLLPIAPFDPLHDSSTSRAHLMRCSFWAHVSYLKPFASWLTNLMSPCDQPLNIHLPSSFHPFDSHESSWLTLKHVWMCCSSWAMPLIFPSSCPLPKHALLILLSFF